MYDVEWDKNMIQTFEYYEVDPETWMDKRLLDKVVSSNISYNINTDTQGTATIDADDLYGEMYVRIYLVIEQNEKITRIPLATNIIQTPSYSFDGIKNTISIEAYSPLLELKENYPPIGYSIEKKHLSDPDYIHSVIYRNFKDNCRAPIILDKGIFEQKGIESDFVANTSDDWFTFLNDFMSKYNKYITIDPNGVVSFDTPKDITQTQPVWTYTDDNSSILNPEIDIQNDIYGIPNVLEVVVETESNVKSVTITNDDPNSLTSTVTRGRRIVSRITNPEDLPDNPTDTILKEYAENKLKQLSTIEYTINYKHGYCPVRVGDCVRLNYKRAGLTDIKALVTSQNIECTLGCSVSETATFTQRLWK